MADLIGRNLGRYHLEALLGAGGMGQVYRARDPGLDRQVAVKVLAATLAQESGYLERFQREARAAGKLSHPNIVPVYDVGEQDGLMYLVMQLVPGGTLREYLARRGALPLGEAISILEQVASALQHAHERGLIHRDVKPANILMSSDGRALLADFGIVRVTQNNETALTRMGAFVGSPEYAAPEMVLGQSADQRVDIYALGVMAYQMLAGRLPFTGLNPMALLVQHAQEQPPSPRSFNPAISPAVEAVILKAMAKAPAARYQSAIEMVQALKAATGGQTLATQAAPPPAQQPTPVPGQRPTPPPVLPEAPPATVISPPPGSAQQGAMSSLPTIPGSTGQLASAGPPTYPPAGPAFTSAPPPGSGPATQMPGNWASALDQSRVTSPPPTFFTGFNQAPGAPTNPPFAPPAPPARRRRTLPALIAAIALVLIVGGGGLLAYGASAGWFKTARGPVTVATTAKPSATSTATPSPTATPTAYYMAHIFLVMNGDLQNGDTADTQNNIDANHYLQHEGARGDFYQMGDALTFGRAAGTAQRIFDSNGHFKFVVLSDRFDTFQHAQQYFQRDLTLFQSQVTMQVGEQAVEGMVPVGNQQTYQLVFRDRNIIVTIATIPMDNPQGFDSYFLSVAQAVDQRGHRCTYNVQDINQRLPGDPSDC